jgi:hypothetical protein
MAAFWKLSFECWHASQQSFVAAKKVPKGDIRLIHPVRSCLLLRGQLLRQGFLDLAAFIHHQPRQQFGRPAGTRVARHKDATDG